MEYRIVAHTYAFPSLFAVYCIRSSQVLDIKCLPLNRSVQNMIDVVQTVSGFKL